MKFNDFNCIFSTLSRKSSHMFYLTVYQWSDLESQLKQSNGCSSALTSAPDCGPCGPRGSFYCKLIERPVHWLTECPNKTSSRRADDNDDDNNNNNDNNDDKDDDDETFEFLQTYLHIIYVDRFTTFVCICCCLGRFFL